jgi:MraZ protein
VPLFLSAFTNRIDKKGRVSVPASFRAELEQENQIGFIAFPHLESACLEAWDRGRMRQFADAMEDHSHLSEEYDAAGYILGRSRELTFDPEGRVTIPPYMLDHAGITDSVLFFGRGNSFQLWDPARYEAEEARIRAAAASFAKTIKLGRPGRGGAA